MWGKKNNSKSKRLKEKNVGKCINFGLILSFSGVHTYKESLLCNSGKHSVILWSAVQPQYLTKE